MNLESKTKLCVNVGQSANSANGGYNGGGSGVTCKSDYTFTSLGGGGVSQVGLNPGNFLFKSDYSCNHLISASCSGGSTDRTECQSKTLIFHLVATEEE